MSEQHSIHLRDIPLRLRVGVPEAERALPQDLLVEISLEIRDPPIFFHEDDLRQTIDYDAILAFLRDGLAVHGPFALIETIADRICAFCLSLSKRVELVDVRVIKPSVLPAQMGKVSVQLRRSRNGPLGAHPPGESLAPSSNHKRPA